MNDNRSRMNSEVVIPAVLGAAFVSWFLILPSWQNIQGHWSVSQWKQVRAIARRLITK